HQRLEAGGAEGPHHLAKVALPWQHQQVGVPRALRRVRHPRLQAGTRQRPGDARKVPCAVIDDDRREGRRGLVDAVGGVGRTHGHSKPLVEGGSSRVTRVAVYSARANAFITASQTWCVSSPVSTRTWIVAPQWLAKPRRNSRRW